MVVNRIFSPYDEPTFIPEKQLLRAVLFAALNDLDTKGYDRDTAVEWFRFEGSHLPRGFSYNDVCEALDLDEGTKTRLRILALSSKKGVKLNLSIQKRHRVLGDYTIKRSIKR